MQMIIGDYIFSLPTAEYDALNRKQSWRWVERKRLNRKPALQFQGANLSEVVLSGTIHVEDSDHTAQQEAMMDEASKGQPLNMLSLTSDGIGRWFGRWVILDVSFNETDIHGNGSALTVQFSMTLKEYGDDDL